MSPTSIGLFAGLVIALCTVLDGWSGLGLAILFGVIGLVVGRVVSGQLDLTQYIGGSGRGQR